jgi:5-methylcytosine-specific restriction endonuclease McrA
MWEGFDMPEAGHTRMPNNFFEAVAQINNMAELKVVLYVARHTWGFQEFDEHKRIATDEFVHGRKLKNRERMDSGTGLGLTSTKEGIAKAIAHGFLECEMDYSDLARVQKSYRLKMKEDDQEQQPPEQPKQKNITRLVQLQTMPYAEYLQSPEWKKKRAKALRFAQFKCQLCNESNNLNVHHRSYERRGNEPLGDLIVLCKDCHSIFHQNKELA